MDIVTEIATPSFAETHADLFHYTNFNGLRGIITSNCFWSMQFDHLNDTTEINILKQPLASSLAERFRVLLKRLQRERFSVKHAVKKTGMSLMETAVYQAGRLVEGFYQSSLTTPFERSVYITSFCTRMNDIYSRENGLLSQWRGYGSGGGGYCIVFDTKELLSLLRAEYSSSHYISFRLDEVIYYTNSLSVERNFKELLDECEQVLIALTEKEEILPAAIAHFLRLAPMLKHQGFREENEARIVAWPATEEDNIMLRKKGHTELLRVKPVHTIGQSGRRHISLFETLNIKLPINRVIVGPSHLQSENYHRARELLPSAIELTRSETPFVEQARVASIPLRV
jgi:hypothetical protein